MKRTWWLILRNEVVIGAGETREVAVMKVGTFLQRIPYRFFRKGGKDIWTNEVDMEVYSILEVEEKNGN